MHTATSTYLTLHGLSMGPQPWISRECADHFPCTRSGQALMQNVSVKKLISMSPPPAWEHAILCKKSWLNFAQSVSFWIVHMPSSLQWTLTTSPHIMKKTAEIPYQHNCIYTVRTRPVTRSILYCH